MLTKDKINLVNILILSYFLAAFIEFMAEFFAFSPLVLIARIVTPFILMLLYKLNTTKSNPMVYTLFGLVLLSNILFFYKNSPYFFIAVMVSTIQRLVMLVIVFQSFTRKRYLSILLSTIPFIVIFYYLNSSTNEFALIEFNALFFQSILISLLGGISLSEYLQNDNRQHSWLLISTLLFIGIQFVVFIERYFFTVISLRVFGLIGVVLNNFGIFTFYKFVIAAEKEK